MSNSYPDPPESSVHINSVGHEAAGATSEPEDAATAYSRFKGNRAMARMAREPGELDIHVDVPVLHLLEKDELHISSVTPAQIRRVRKRARDYRVRYVTSDGVRELEIRRVMRNGSTRLVPPVGERQAVIQRVHELSGH